MEKLILEEMKSITVTIASLEDKKMSKEEKNFITGRLCSICNIFETYLTK